MVGGADGRDFDIFDEWSGGDNKIVVRASGNSCDLMLTANTEDHLLQELVESIDFYSTSSVRDLLFHVQEHRFTLPEIETALESLGAEFIGFELTNPQIKNNFQEINPGNEALTSLSHWHQFEQNNTDTFAGMYQFWVQKI